MKTTLEISHALINRHVKNANIYYHKNSIWLIFPDTKKWVIEIMNGGTLWYNTLWYNYDYFKHLFKIIGIDIPESGILITKWVEEVFKCSLKNSWSSIIPGELDWSHEFNPEEVIRETKPHYRMLYNPMNFEPQFFEEKRIPEVEDILDNNIGTVIELPDRSGELKGYSEWYNVQENRLTTHNDFVTMVLDDGFKLA